MLRRAIRDQEKLKVIYTDGDARETRRIIKPLAIIYYVDVVVLVSWCELRNDFRHFRVDRMSSCSTTGERFTGQEEQLLTLWREKYGVR